MSDLRHELHRHAIAMLLAPIRDVLEDDSVSEVMINGPDDVRVERGGQIEKVEARFESDEDLLGAARQIAQFVGKRIDEHSARFDARLPDGSRVHVVLPPVSRQGVSLAIRKFFRSGIDLARLIELGSLTPDACEYLDLLIKAGKNLIVSGGTGTGIQDSGFLSNARVFNGCVRGWSSRSPGGWAVSTTPKTSRSRR